MSCGTTGCGGAPPEAVTPAATAPPGPTAMPGLIVALTFLAAPGRVQEILGAGQAFDLNLSRPVPVYFTYITAWAEPAGGIQFRPDIYGRDGMRDAVASHERDPSDGPDAYP